MSQESSLPQESNGRGLSGRFAPGNKFCGKGKPHAAKVQKLRSSLLNAVSPADLKEVAKQLVAAAKQGEVSAAKLLFDRLLGPPVPLDVEERLKAVEERLSREVPSESEEWLKPR